MPHASPPPEATNTFSLIRYYFFPRQTQNMYRIDVEACGVLPGGSHGFGRSQQQVRVYPKDTYKFSAEIPALGKKSYERGRHVTEDGSVVDSTESTRASLGESETTGHSESVSDQKLSVTDSYAYKTRQGGLEETNTTSLDRNNKLTSSSELEKVDPIDHPAKEAAASISLQRNGTDIQGTQAIGQVVNGIINLQNEIASVMNFIEKFQPQVGWKFVFELELFKGEVSYEWGYKEWEDHTVFEWWKLDIGMKLFSLFLELRFGANLSVCGFGVTVLVFGNTSVDAGVNAEHEAEPGRASAPWELAVESEPKGELGIRAALGSDWVKAEGKLTCGFPFEAKVECSTREPFHVDWKLDFSGIKASVVGHVRFVGSIQKDWTVIEERKNWKKGRFPSGDTHQKPLRGRHGNVAA